MKATIKKLFFVVLILFLFGQIMAQESEYIKGEVYQQMEDGKKEYLTGANVYWLNTSIGSTSDQNGKFKLEREKSSDQLVVSFIGFKSDTVNVKGQNYIAIKLESSVDLNEVNIEYRQRSTVSSHSSAIKVDNIGEKELLKAACCNLSESFETSPSVDVSFTDAVTGTRQIELLGLAERYTQITRENMADVRGLAAMYGLTFTPGTWIKSIQLNKGAGSVVNGFESIAGQINVELQKPEEAEKLYLNLYANQAGRIEFNANMAYKLSEKWSTALLLHAKDNSIKFDNNDDGFLDMPLIRQFIGLNRWKYSGDKGLRLQFGIKWTDFISQGGQMNFDPESDEGQSNFWGMTTDINRWEAWAKIGKVFFDQPWKSFGLQLSGLYHDQSSFFGLNKYLGNQQGFYGNFIYQTMINNTNHVIKMGASLQYDDYKEELNLIHYDRVEVVPGIYGEYTYTLNEKFSAVAGLRADLNSIYGFFMTPRLHLRYAPNPKTVLRASAGRGQRTANVIAENMGLLASSRQWIIRGDMDTDKAYGLNPEVAWNMGASISQDFELFYKEGSISADYHYTTFQNQIVVDRDFDTHQVLYYNLDGISYSHSVQFQVDYELINRFDLRLAYRWLDVKTTYSGNLLEKPLIARNRAFINLAYQTRNYWVFDFTLNWQGQKRIPFTAGNSEPYRLPDYSPNFYIINLQVSKNWRKKFEVYAGVENLLNFRQEDPILSSDDPFGENFDASMIWGPVFGRNIYAGLRYYIR